MGQGVNRKTNIASLGAGPVVPDFLARGGAAGRAMRAFDWAASPIGPPETWPAALQTLISLMLSSAQPMFVAWGSAGTLVYNDAYAPLLGRKHPAALGQPYLDVWHEARDEIAPLVHRVMAGESVTSEDLVVRVDRQGGVEEAHFAFSSTPVRDDDGNLAGLFCCCIEITGTVLARRMQTEQNRRLVRIFEQAPSFIAIVSGPEHRVVQANAAYRRLAGGADPAGKTISEFLPPDIARAHLQILDEVYRTGQSARVPQTPQDLPASEDSIYRERLLEFIYQPITDARGQITGIFVAGMDMTDRARVEAELRQLNATLEQRIEERTSRLLAREALIRTFYQHSSECHAVLVEAGGGKFRYEEVNPATLRLYGMTREQVVGHTVDDVFGAQAAQFLNSNLSECLRAGAPHRYERMQGGATIEAVATPVPHEHGSARRLVVSARDVTEQRALEERLRQAQKMEAVGQLTGGLAHDFNNLLTAISGSLERMRLRISQGRIGELEKYLVSAEAAAKRAAGLTHRLLAFSRRQTLDPKPCDVNILVSGLSELIENTTGPGIGMRFEATAGLWHIVADQNQLENALLNLCINARDAMPDGGNLTIQTRNESFDEKTAHAHDLPPGDYVSLSVRDTGTGMSPDVISRAFDPFFTTKPLGAGTGLGLSMVYGFVRQSGGQARIISELGSGTTVCLYFPRETGSKEAALF